MENNNAQVLHIKATDQTLMGVYANMVQIGHTAEEFVLDFANILPPHGNLTARVVVSPSHAKRLLKTLEENIKTYEKQFGVISLAVVPDQKIGFRTE